MALNDEQTLIEKARKGNSAALDELAGAVQPRLRAYLLRVTLDHALADDLLQDTLLELCQSVGALRDARLFWPWLYRIAMSKFQTHLRREQSRRACETAAQDHFFDRLAATQGREGLSRMLKTELSRNILTAIETLDPRDRAVLSMRCFDRLGYPDIAQTMETTETHARVLFFRAKQSLKKALVRQGLKGSSLVMALGFFGSLTETAQAGATAAGSLTVSSAAVRISLSTVITAVCGTKMACGIAAGLIAAVGLLTTAGLVRSAHLRRTALPPREAVSSFHFIAQSRQNTPDAVESLSKGAYEQWYYFPEGIDGAFFLRMQRWDARMQERLCAWLQNGIANHYWHAGQNTVYLSNHRLWGRSLTHVRIRRLPTDEPALTAFLDRMEAVDTGLEVRRDPRSGMIVETVDHRFVDAQGFRSRYAYNQTEGTTFENPWTDIPVVDDRDAMRRRGWTYFTIEGTVNGQELHGRGRIPFFYNHSLEHPAWLVLELPDGGTIIDTPDAAIVLDAVGNERVRYAGGRFFTGLLRPWQGMHTVDSVRRDAARYGIPFVTNQLSEFHKTGSIQDYYADTQVLCTTEIGGRTATLDYLVAMQDDVLKRIAIRVDNVAGSTRQATLQFTYHQQLPDAADFQMPLLDAADAVQRADSGPRWLFDLVLGVVP